VALNVPKGDDSLQEFRDKARATLAVALLARRASHRGFTAKYAFADALGKHPSLEGARALVAAWSKDQDELWEEALRLQRGAEGALALAELAKVDRAAAVKLGGRVLADLVHAREARALAAELAPSAPPQSAIHAVASASSRPDLVFLDAAADATEADLARVRAAVDEELEAWGERRGAAFARLSDSDAPLVLRVLADARGRSRAGVSSLRTACASSSPIRRREGRARSCANPTRTRSGRK
jgi:hypothetical protein